jgi:hypothetical protein
MSVSQELLLLSVMDEFIDELERRAYPLISAGVRDTDIAQLSLDAWNAVARRHGMPERTDKPNLSGDQP